MRGWLNIMLRIVLLAALFTGALQANAACVVADPAPSHAMAGASMDHVQGSKVADQGQKAGHLAGSTACLQACLPWIIEPSAVPQPAAFAVTAALRPHRAAVPASAQADTVERPPKAPV